MKISAIETEVPLYQLYQADIAHRIGNNQSIEISKKLIENVFARAHIDTRYSVLDEEKQNQLFETPAPTTHTRMQWYAQHAPKLALKAAQKVLKTSDIDPNRITHLVITTCTGFYSPGIDIYLMRQAGLSATVSRTQLGFHGCHGAFNALRVAKAFTDQNAKAVILIVCVELCTLHLHPCDDSEDIVANSLFADGAAAIICQSEGEGLTFDAPYSIVLPETEDLMSWAIQDSGFRMGLSSKLPDRLQNRLKKDFDVWLRTENISFDTIKGYAVHPGGPRILHACESALELSKDSLAPSRQVLKEFGNMSSPTIFFVIKEMLRNNIPLPYACLGFGPGISTEFFLLR